MKAKYKLLLIVMLLMVIGLNAYLLNVKGVLNQRKNNTSNVDKSTANYIDIDFDSENVELSFEEKIEPEAIIVYEDMTLEELSNKINSVLNSTISGKGELIASYSLEMGVDPYLATAIMLHETGCKWDCSYITKNCNNVGGQKGTGCGSYSYFGSLDEGIRAFIDNLYRNYISYGLTTPELINPKYAEDPNWAKNVSKYIEDIKAQ